MTTNQPDPVQPKTSVSTTIGQLAEIMQILADGDDTGQNGALWIGQLPPSDIPRVLAMMIGYVNSLNRIKDEELEEPYGTTSKMTADAFRASANLL